MIRRVHLLCGSLTITDEQLAAARRAIPEDDRPEWCFLNEMDAGGMLPIQEWCILHWADCPFESLALALSFTQGNADLMICWYRDRKAPLRKRYSGVRVRNGKATKCSIAQLI